MADLKNLLKLLELWLNLEEKSTSASPEVESGYPANRLISNDQNFQEILKKYEHIMSLETSRANMYARFIRMSEPYIQYVNGTNKDYETLRTCVYGQLRLDKKNGLL